MIFRNFLIAVVFLTPLVSFAEVRITEIMYDSDGSDSGREWVEIWNSGGAPETVIGGSGNGGWRLYEVHSSGPHNHTLGVEAYRGSMILAEGHYAVVAQDGEAFLVDNPSYTGTIFTSSAFSLSNTTQALGLKVGSDGTPWSEITYMDSMGAKGDGNSLQNVGGSWVSALPTPGASNGANVAEESNAEDVEENESAPSGSASSGSSDSSTPAKTITVAAGAEKQIAFAGADAAFKGIAYGLEGEVISNARFVWSFGDGSIKEGKSVSHAYQYPGEYIVVLQGVSGEYSASDKVFVTVLQADISVDSIGTPIDFFVSLKNDTKYEINLEGWVLRSDKTSFMIPANTRIASGKTLKFPPNVTGLLYGNNVALLFPNGNTASVYVENKTRTSESIKTVSIVETDAKTTSGDSHVPTGADEKNIFKKSDIEPSPAEETQEAAIVKIGDSSDSGVTLKWILIFIALIALSLGGLFIVVREGFGDPTPVGVSAEDFTIIEEKNEKER